MSNVNYNEEFAFKKNIFQELIKLSEKSLYNIKELTRLGLKQTQINQIAINNTINLLIDSDVIILQENKCKALPHSQEKINKLIINQLKRDNVFKEIENVIERDSDGQSFVDSGYLSDKYSGVLPLIEYLGLVEYDKNKKIFYFSEQGKSVCNKPQKTLKELEQDMAAKKERGAEAESYILLLEKKRLKDHQNLSDIKKISDDDVGAGYDIESFQSINSVSIDKFIEVKSYKNTNTFYWSINEIKKAKKLSENYVLVVVNSNKINESSYQPKEIKNPYKFFNMKEVLKSSSRLSDSDDLPQIQGESYSLHSKHLW